MREFKYVITDEIGLHARPAGLLVKAAKGYSSRITLTAGGKSTEATRLMMVMALGAKQGTELLVQAEGEDEDAAIAGMEAFMKENL